MKRKFIQKNAHTIVITAFMLLTFANFINGTLTFFEFNMLIISLVILHTIQFILEKIKNILIINLVILETAQTILEKIKK